MLWTLLYQENLVVFIADEAHWVPKWLIFNFKDKKTNND